MRLLILLICVLCGCSIDRKSHSSLFTDVAEQSGIDFRNDLQFTNQLNPYTYRNFYNGAGVAIGDINNDGLLDVYLSGNQVDNKLYLNKGGFTFADITQKAHVACTGVWSTGVTMVDINADGLLDIYVCKSGIPGGLNRNNELFINNGDLTFTERSKEYGLDITGLSVQAAFFDYDKDGDLDCYLLTNSFKSIGAYDLSRDQRNVPDAQGGGNKFFVNENGKFIDYSAQAKIYRSNIGFGLGITLGDFNGDTWTDIFVSNDFFERDYLYINDQHGSFKESLTSYFQSISMGSMGADFADLDNDGDRELFVTEMLPDSLGRRKTKTVFESWNKYQMNVQNGYHHQVSRNVLQKKSDDSSYVEIGRFAGVAATEWSWGALLFDMDNDGMRDIFVANGIYKDLLDRDYLAYTGAEENMRKILKEEKDAIVKLIDMMPSSVFPNYAFRNEGDLHFKNVATEWGLGSPSYSSGSAYGDLDNDGDLDIITNNINALAGIFRNNTDTSSFKSISITLTAPGNNRFAVGAEIEAYCGTRIFVADNFVTRGFQSSIQPIVTIGLGKDINIIDSIVIRWPDGGRAALFNVAPNKRLSVVKNEIEALRASTGKKEDKPFKLVHQSTSFFRHRGSDLIDFNRDRLLPMMYSNETPSLLKGDINNDGKEELYVGGGKDQQGMFIHFKSGIMESYLSKGTEQFSLSEETKGAFVDVDNDEDLDFYLAMGGRFFPKSSSALIDKILLNDGKGGFTESPYPLPIAEFISTSVVKPIDFDNDGDSDLIVGERFDPFAYGLGGRGFLLENNGHGLFKDVTAASAPALIGCGMITDIEVCDMDKDGWRDVAIVGDWMPIIILANNKGRFEDKTQKLGLNNTEGWWHDIEIGDFNKDGKVDFVLGNHGLNSFFKPGDKLYINDFDSNGSIEQIFCTEVNGKYYPIADKDDLISQLPSFKKDLLYYKAYSKKSIEELVSQKILGSSRILEVKILASVLILSSKEGYTRMDLPREAQYSPIYSLLVSDFDNDGVEDVIAGGNQYKVKPQFGRCDASQGWFFKGTMEAGNFRFQPGIDLNVKGEIRDIELVNNNGVRYIFFAKNDDDLEIFKIPD